MSALASPNTIAKTNGNVNINSNPLVETMLNVILLGGLTNKWLAYSLLFAYSSHVTFKENISFGIYRM